MFRLRPAREVLRDPMYLLILALIALHLVLRAIDPDGLMRTVVLVFAVATSGVEIATRPEPKKKADDEPAA